MLKQHAVVLVCIGLSASACTSARPAAAPDTVPTVSSAPSVTSDPVATTTMPSVAVPHYVDENGFDDHTVPSVATVEELPALSRLGVGGQTAGEVHYSGVRSPRRCAQSRQGPPS